MNNDLILLIGRGELAALSAALLWAVSSVVYTLLGQQIAPLLLNFLKGAIAIFFLILTLLITQDPLPQVSWLVINLLLISGILGIGLGDTAYFAALNRLGARRTLLLTTLAPPLTALLAWLTLGEQLSLWAWGGIVFTVLGVAWVITERTTDVSVGSRQGYIGIIWALVAALAQASGAVLSRAALSTSDITSLWSALLRLLAGTGITLFLLGIRPTPLPPKLFSVRLMGVIAITAFGSTFLGIWLQQTALKFSPAGIAQTLLATSPLFVLPITLGMGEKVSYRAVVGVAIAIAGIALLFQG
jgi:drug/metabolite transporter (DMT)-like permease